MSYEEKVRDAFRAHGVNAIQQTAGFKGVPDVTIVHKNGTMYGVEVKTKRAREGGQSMFHFLNDEFHISGFFKTLIGDYKPFDGSIPSFVKGNKSRSTWDMEKHKFKGEYIDVNSNTVSEYYKNKGSAYIYIETIGLFHTGLDPFNFGVPYFEAPTRIRIRCKQHTGSTVPNSVMASLVFKTNKRITSNFSLNV